MSTTGKRTHSFLTMGLSFPQSRNLSPFPGGFPAQNSEHLVFTHANLSFTKRNNLLGKITQFFPRIAKSKPNQSRSIQKEDKNVHLPKRKKNNTFDKQIRPIHTNKQTKISVHNVFQAKTGLQPINKLALFSLKQINTLYTRGLKLKWVRGPHMANLRVGGPH